MILYLETNWIVSCVLLHHEHRQDALELINKVEEGLCTLKIPSICFLEAKHAIEKETTNQAKAIKTMEKTLVQAARNTQNEDLRELAESLRNAQSHYVLSNPQEALSIFCNDYQHFSFSNPIEEQQLLDQLRDSTEFREKDIVDLHILSAVLADRSVHPDQEAAFISTNKKEFQVSGHSTKLPRDIYTNEKLVYLDKFKLEFAQRKWERENQAGWIPPIDPHTDPKIKNLQKLLPEIPEHLRDEALNSIQALIDSSS